jgi:hypothetical protein
MSGRRCLALIGLLLLQLACSKNAQEQTPTAEVVTLEDRLHGLEDCNVYLKKGKTVDDLLEVSDRATYETQPYVVLLSAIGGQGSDAPLAENMWWLDLECVEAADTYVKVLKQMVAMTGEDVPISKVSATFDYARESGQLRFFMDKKPHLVNLTIKGNLLDEAALVQVARIIESQLRLKRFVIYSLPENRRLIGCVTPRDIMWLDRETRLDFTFLTG